MLRTAIAVGALTLATGVPALSAPASISTSAPTGGSSNGRASAPSATEPAATYRTRLQRVAALHRQQQYGAALDAIDRAIALQPRAPQAWELRGDILLDSGQPRVAVSSYREAIALGGGGEIADKLADARDLRARRYDYAGGQRWRLQ